jgi:arylsulfatase A-like enzyme
MGRRDLLLAAAGASRVAHARDRKPNLLFIMADDHAGYVLGAAGNRRVLTPNLDRLTSESTRFARNYYSTRLDTTSS